MRTLNNESSYDDVFEEIITDAKVNMAELEDKNVSIPVTSNFQYKTVALSERYLRHMPSITSRQAQILLLPLCFLSWTKTGNRNEIYVDLDDMKEFMNLKGNYEQRKEFRRYIRRIVKELNKIEEQTGITIEVEKDIIKYEIRRDTLKELEGNGKGKRFFVLLTDDLLKMKSKNTWNLLKTMLLAYDSRKTVQYIALTTTVLKEAFGMKIKEYTRGTRQHFNRYEFEKKTLEPGIEEISKMKCFEIKKNKEGNLFSKRYSKEVTQYGNSKLRWYVLNYQLANAQSVARKEMEEKSI